MRTLAITKRILKELLRDRRTLALMFLAPILIMWLMNVMFSANSKTDVEIALSTSAKQFATTSLRSMGLRLRQQKRSAKPKISSKVTMLTR